MREGGEEGRRGRYRTFNVVLLDVCSKSRRKSSGRGNMKILSKPYDQQGSMMLQLRQVRMTSITGHPYYINNYARLFRS